MTLPTADRLAIHELLALHGHLMDDGQFDRLGELFTSDVVYDLTELVASGFSFGDVNFSFSGILIDSEENI